MIQFMAGILASAWTRSDGEIPAPVGAPPRPAPVRPSAAAPPPAAAVPVPPPVVQAPAVEAQKDQAKLQVLASGTAAAELDLPPAEVSPAAGNKSGTQSIGGYR